MPNSFFYIFAMRLLLINVVFQIQSLFTYHKGIVSNSFFGNVKSEGRTSRGLYPHFIKRVNYFLMRPSENNLQGEYQVPATVTSCSRHELIPTLQQLFKQYHSRWFSIRVTSKGAFIQFRTGKKQYHFGRGDTLKEAYTDLLIRLQSFYQPTPLT